MGSCRTCAHALSSFTPIKAYKHGQKLDFSSHYLSVRKQEVRY